MGCLNGYVQRSLSFRPSLHEILVRRALKDKIPNYAVVKAAFSAAIQNGQIKKRIVRAVKGRTACITKGYRYTPVYVNADDYRVVKISSVTEGVPVYLLIEEIIVSYLLSRQDYAKYVEKYFA